MFGCEQGKTQLHHCVPKLEQVQQLFDLYKERMEKLRVMRRQKEATNTLGKINFEKYYPFEDTKSEFCTQVDCLFKFSKVLCE